MIINNLGQRNLHKNLRILSSPKIFPNLVPLITPVVNPNHHRESKSQIHSYANIPRIQETTANERIIPVHSLLIRKISNVSKNKEEPTTNYSPNDDVHYLANLSDTTTRNQENQNDHNNQFCDYSSSNILNDMVQTFKSKVQTLLTQSKQYYLDDDANLDGSPSDLVDLIQLWHNTFNSILHFELEHQIVAPSSNKSKRYRNIMTQSYHSNTDFISPTNINHNLRNQTQAQLLSLKQTCALTMHKLLQYHIKHHLQHNDDTLKTLKHKATNTKNNSHRTTPCIQPFLQTIQAWQHTNTPKSGHYAAIILDSWGNLYGGDVNYAPSINEFNLVLDAYAKSSYLHYSNDTSDVNRKYDNIDQNDNNIDVAAFLNGLPAEKSWEIYQLLSSLFFSRPNIVTCVHVIDALTNHALVMKHVSNRKYDDTVIERRQTPREINSTMSDKVAAIRAFSVWKNMLTLLSTNEDINLNPTNMKDEEERHFYTQLILKAHSSIISLSAHGLLKRDDDNRTRGQLISKHFDSEDDSIDMTALGSDTKDLLDRILTLHKKDIESTPHDVLEEVYFPYLRQIYLSTMVAYSKGQEAMIKYQDYIQRDPFSDDSMDTFMKLSQSIIEHATLANDLLSHMKNELNMKPLPDHYNSVIHSYSNCLKDNILSRSENCLWQDGMSDLDRPPHHVSLELLEEMENAYNIFIDDSTGLHLNHHSIPKMHSSLYGKVIWSWYQAFNYNIDGSKPSDHQLKAAKNIEVVLRRMMTLFQKKRLYPDQADELTFALNHVMMMYDKISEDIRAVDQAITLFRWFLKLQENSDFSSPRPDAATYGIYLKILARNHMKDSGSNALQIISKMEKEYTDGISKVKPNIAHYSSLITILLKVQRADMYNKIQNTLQIIDNLYNSYTLKEREYSGYNPNMLYNSIISSLPHIIEPHKVVNESLHLLQTLQQRYDDTFDPRFKPTVQFYGSVLNILSKQKDGSSLPIAYQIFGKMESMYNNGDDSMMPNKFCYTSLMTALSRSGKSNAANQCEELLRKLEILFEKTHDVSMKPDNIVYSTVIDAWSRSRQPEAAEHALRLLEEMEEKAENGDLSLKPNAVVYTNVINALRYSKRDDIGKEAQKLLKRMDDSFSQGNVHAKPDTFTYTAVISAWGKSKSKDKAEKAWDLLVEMKNRYEKGDILAKPNLFAFNAVMNACGFIPKNSSNDVKAKALKIALMTQNLLLNNPDKYGVANSITFATLLATLGNLLPNENDRDKFVSTSFERCCHEGQVDERVLEALRRYTPNLYNQLPGERGKKTIENLPKKWSRNSKSVK